ncbi:hypothetical protein S40293_01209 [Stachybotrys chartarum IBT 40293]|nr:hypothetical protein S40293_01209 [Stachybotrys chartarum IBT 40293]
MRVSAYISIVAGLVAGVRSLDLMEAVAQAPSCAVSCFTQMLSITPCGMLDAECLCNDDNFHERSSDCVVERCSVPEAMETARLEAAGCNRPKRSRRHELYLPLIVEVPAAFMPWVRMYARWVTLHHFALDDYLMMFCAIVYTAFAVICKISGNLGFGYDTWFIDPQELTEALRWIYIEECFYFVCLTLTKVSVICFYLRIFPQKAFRILSLAVIAFVVLSNVIFLVIQLKQCTPLNMIWEGWQDKNRAQHCVNIQVLAVTSASFGIAQDLIILLMPLPLLYHLKVERRVKFGITLMFSLGIFVLVTSIMRLTFMTQFGNTHNPSWDYVDPVIWTGLEVAVSIVVACLPATRVLVSRNMPLCIKNMFGSSSDSQEDNKDHAIATIGGSGGKGKKDRRQASTAGLSALKKTLVNESEIELGIQSPNNDGKPMSPEPWRDSPGPSVHSPRAVKEKRYGIQVIPRRDRPNRGSFITI